jgi:hypothetical protein
MNSVKCPNIVLQRAVATGVRVLSFVATSSAAAATSLTLVRLVKSDCEMPHAACLAVHTGIHSLAIASCLALVVESQSDRELFIIESPSQFVPQEALLPPSGVLSTGILPRLHIEV